MMASIPGLYIDADMRELSHSLGVIHEYGERMRTEAHVGTVIAATHSVFANMFDTYISNAAKTSRENFHHVYEYKPSAGGDPYLWVGNPRYQLWEHTIQRTTGMSRTFSWNWKAAKQPLPSYLQRRKSKVGEDPLRDISNKAFSDLVKNSENRRYVFAMKAPSLEYGLVRVRYPRLRFIVLPSRKVGSDGTRGKTFVTSTMTTSQEPGPTRGVFTTAWVGFWSTVVAERWNDVIGKEVEKDAARRIASAIRKGKVANRGARRMRANTFTDYTEAFAAGQQQAISAINASRKSIREIEKKRGYWYNAATEF